jgi:pimeloyl-ACP methyl ester carboxylesterase
MSGRRVHLAVVAAIALATTVISPAQAEDLSGLYSVGDHNLRIACRGSNAPTIVFEPALGQGSITRSWGHLQERLSLIARVCVYDRAGQVGSDPPPNPPVTVGWLANDLHSLLQSAQVPGPYLIVGMQFGSWVARLYASRYPSEVAGLVFVDAPVPSYPGSALALLPGARAIESPSLATLRADLLAPATRVQFGIDVEASAAEFATAGTLKDIPLAVLATGIHPLVGDPSELPDGLLEALKRHYIDANSALARLSTQGWLVDPKRDWQAPSIYPSTGDLIVTNIRRCIAAWSEAQVNTPS